MNIALDRCEDHWLGHLQCIREQGHNNGPIYQSSQTGDRHADD